MDYNEQIELAEEMIRNLQDYILLMKLEPKLKVERINDKIDNVVDFIKINVRNLK